MAQENIPQLNFTRRVLIVAAIALCTVLLTLFALAAIEIWLYLFVSALIAVLLSGMRGWLSERTPLPDRLALAVVVLAILLGFGLLFIYIGPRIFEQIAQLTDQLPESTAQLEKQLRNTAWGERLLDAVDEIPQVETLLQNGSMNIFSEVTGIFSRSLGILANLIIILFIGLYLAISPRLYIDGFIRLFPISARPRAHDILDDLARKLRWWLISRFISMFIIGFFITVGLMLLGMPLALALGVIAALLTFIPNIGPVLAIIPGLLTAALQGPQMILYVFLLYIGAQFVESYFITPIVEKRTVALPPALVMAAQLLLALLVGQIGVVLAAPLVVIAMVLVKSLYVRGVLKDRSVEVNGHPTS